MRTQWSFVFNAHHQAVAEVASTNISSLPEVPPDQNDPNTVETKIAKLYLVSDILYIAGHSSQRNRFEELVEGAIIDIGQMCRWTNPGQLKTIQAEAEGVLYAWDVWRIFDASFTSKLRRHFLFAIDSKNDSFSVEGIQQSTKQLPGPEVERRKSTTKSETDHEDAKHSRGFHSKTGQTLGEDDLRIYRRLMLRWKPLKNRWMVIPSTEKNLWMGKNGDAGASNGWMFS